MLPERTQQTRNAGDVRSVVLLLAAVHRDRGPSSAAETTDLVGRSEEVGRPGDSPEVARRADRVEDSADPRGVPEDQEASGRVKMVHRPAAVSGGAIRDLEYESTT